MEIPIFPLHTVLFPGGILPLKIFEQRYMDMTTACLKESKPFGVCLIKEGAEVGAPAVPETIGCLARITDWDMQQLGVLHLKTEGFHRFEIHRQNVAANGLRSANVTLLPDEPSIPVPPEHASCAKVLELIIEKVGDEHFKEPFRFHDAVWVSFRLAEVLPLKLIVKQKMLELSDTAARLNIIHKFLAQQGLTS